MVLNNVVIFFHKNKLDHSIGLFMYVESAYMYVNEYGLFIQ